MSYTYNDIDHYLNGELSGEALLAFEQELSSNQQLQEQIKAYRLAQAVIHKHHQAESSLPELKEILTPFTNQYFKKQKAKLFTMKRTVYLLAAAASVALIVLLTIPGTAPDDFTINDMPGATTRGIADEKAKAAQFFNDKKYTEAITVLDELKATGDTDATVDFYLALSLLQTKDYARALPLFETSANSTSAYAEDANFFTALCAYRLQLNVKALEYVKKVKEKNRYWKNANAIRKKIK